MSRGTVHAHRKDRKEGRYIVIDKKKSVIPLRYGYFICPWEQVSGQDSEKYQSENINDTKWKFKGIAENVITQSCSCAKKRKETHDPEWNGTEGSVAVFC